jgi:sugar-specific transcriptional regulator TrmB
LSSKISKNLLIKLKNTIWGENLNGEKFHLQTLSQLGLTQNQAKLCLCLLFLGKSTAASLAKQSGLARQEVYRVLEELFNDGLVEKTIDTPTRFQAVTIQEVISMLSLKKDKQFEQTQQRLKQLLIDCSVDKNTANQAEYKIQLIPPKKPSISQRERMLQNAKETVQIISNARRFSQGVTSSFDLFEKILKNNIKVVVIVSIGEEAKNITEKLKRLEVYSNFSIRFATESKASLLVVDKSEALLTLYPQADLGRSPLLWTNQPELLAIYQDYFEAVWNRSQVIPLDIR